MSVNASESVSPLGESQVTARRKRLYHLSRMVMNLKAEWRYPGGKNREFDGVEDEGLIEALRVSGSYIDLIDPLLAGDPFEDQVVKIKAIDGYDYIINFSIFGPGFAVKASRVTTTNLRLVRSENEVDSIMSTMDVLKDYSKSLNLGNVTTDRAFLVGMSLVISFMDDRDDDPDETARLAPLSALVMPTDDELREIRAKLPPSSINYDEEEDLPY